MSKALVRAHGVHIAILTQQISNYHRARFRAAREAFGQLTVISVLNAADFPEFLAEQHDGGLHDVVKVCDGEADYAAAIAAGTLWGRVQGLLADVRPDVVAVAGWSFPESLAAVAWARSSGRPVVVMSASQAEDSPRALWREQIKGRVVKACDAALVAAERHKAYVVGLGLAPEQVFLGYDAVDNDHFEAGAEVARADAVRVRTREGLPERYLLASGRFIAKKNYPRLVEAFAAALRRADQGHHLVILGDGSERKAIEAAVEATRMSGRVHLPGFRVYDRLPAYYGLAEGFVHVSLAEQWGLVVNEAAAAGVPLIVSRPCGCSQSLVHPGRNGTIVDPRSVDDMAAAIADLMALPAETRGAMAAASRDIVAHWGPARFASGLACATKAAIARRRRRLGLLDQTLFRVLARMRISWVS